MFFSIRSDKDLDFPNHSTLSNGMILNTDEGWTTLIESEYKIYVKGYSDNGIINVNKQSQGNYIAIADNGKHIKITNDINRGSPINLANDHSIITNLPLENSQRIWADCLLTINNEGMVEKESIKIDKEISILSRDDALNRIDQILTQRFRSFLSHNDRPVKIFLSGGLDTMLVYSYLKKMTDDYELCDYEHIDITHFYASKKKDIQQYWGYRQIHHWREPCVLVTGGCGDEFMLRSPSHMMLFLMHWNLTPTDILSPTDHHYKYLTQYQAKYEEQSKNKFWIAISQDYNRVCNKVITMNLDDNQHWHLGNTLTFTPLKDIEITKILLGLSQADLLSQLKNGDISRDLISKNDPRLLQYLSDQKNTDLQINLIPYYDSMRSSNY